MNRIVVGNREFKVVFHRDVLSTGCAIFEGDAGSLDKQKTLAVTATVVRNVKDVDNRVYARALAFKRAVAQLPDRTVRTELWNKVNIRRPIGVN